LPPDGLGVHGTTAPAAENAANHTRYWRSTPFQTSASLRTVDINGWSTTRRLAMRPIHSRADTTRRGAKVVRPGPGQDRRTRGASALLISAALAAAVTGCGNDGDDTAAACDAWASCREGVCGTCLTGVIAGTPDHRDAFLSTKERKAGDKIMICVSRAKSAQLVLDL
jgi:hypothetical protein